MFDVLQGLHLTSGALNETLPVATGNTVVRGSVLVIDSGKFRLCTEQDATDDLIPYVALTATDRTSYMAGDAQYAGTGTALTGSLPGSVDPVGIANAGLAVVTAVPLNIDGKFRISTDLTPAVDSYLTFGAAGALAAGTPGTHTLIGKVTKASFGAYDNFKSINGGLAQGGATSVIEFVSFYVAKQ